MASVGSTDSSTRLPMTALRPRNHYFLILLFTLLSFFPSIISSTASPLNPSSTSPLLSPPSKPTLNHVELEERVSKDRYPTPKSRSISNLESIRGFRFNAPSSPSSSLSEEPSFTSDSNEESGQPSSAFYDSEGSGGDSQSRRNQEQKKKTTEYHEPTISDLTLLPLVLAVTVDGQVHALKRETGQWLWTLHDDGGSALGGSSRSRDIGGVSGPLVRGRGRKSSANAAMNSTSSRAGVTDLDFAGRRSGFREEVGEEEIEDEVYVIEPHSQGDIYLYSKDLTGEPASSSGGSLQKLPLSMQQLVALSPFTFPSDSSRMFVGRKETKLVGVDLKTGRLVGVFGSGAGWCEWDEKKVGRVKTEEECEDEIERRPEDLLYMARTEYHLSIYSKASASLLQTLTYTTYSSSSLGTALQSQWTRTPDARYLQPMHDGSLICFLSGVPGAQWTIAFEVPVVSIFDVAIPKSNDLDMNRKEEQPQPMIFEQPHPLPVEGLPLDFDKLHVLPEATFIGRIQGELFAMSKENFPLVAFAPLNGIDSAALEGITAGEESDGSGLGGRCRGPGCLIGRHRVIPSEITPVENTIDAPEARLGIDAPPISTSPSLDSTKSSPYPPNRSSVLSSINAPLSKLSESNSTALVLFLLAVIGYLYLKKMGTGKEPKSDSVSFKNGQHWIDPAGANASSTFSRDALDASLPPTPITATADLTPIPAVAEVDDLLIAPTPELLVPAIIPLALLPQLEIVSQPPEVLQALRPRSETLTDPRPRSGSFSLSPSPSAFKELPPLPLDDGVEEGDGESGDDQNKENAEGTPRKKGRRRRGKKTKKNGGVKALEDLLAIDGLVTEKELIGLTLGEPELVADADMSLVVAVAADPHLIGGLSVSDTILGYGSHGTVVLRGEFQGRAVAVKRLLKDFVTIATHEVALLQESDDHPHVIRYFCKEQRDTFLYIALELCPASLYDLIDQPSTFPDLVRDFDPKKALRQITGGIRHLHKLKIVHRDIKPQNILVSTSKLGGVRMLISDFGLCKKLDMDESSFQQTVNHAAGSFGYRAPEVLRGQVDPNGGASTPSNSTVDSRHGRESSTGSGTNTDPSMRLTRSIDIFSLGCIFYYVLTGGEHPFGGRYEREMNILNGKLSLDRLDGLGEEALEVQDLITRMVATDPRERPSADSVLLHPFFWNAQKRLLFICDASDRFEIMERDPPTATLLSLEDSSEVVVGEDWQKAIDRTLLDNLGKYRKYDGKSVRDLLRVLRNKKHHYQDLPESVRNHLGDLPGGFLSYFTTRFPHLLLHVYDTVSTHLSDEPMFESTFKIPEDEQ